MNNLECIKNSTHDFDSNEDSLYCAYGCGVSISDYKIELLRKEIAQLKVIVSCQRELVKDRDLLELNIGLRDIQNKKLEAQNKILMEAVEFYASYSPWGKNTNNEYNDTITVLDCEECDTFFNDGYIGGKKARQALEQVRGVK